MKDDRQFYQIIVNGQLDLRWSAWFDGLIITWHVDADEAGPVRQTMLSGYVPDQAALYGLLNKLRDLNLTLLAVTRCTAPGGGIRAASNGGSHAGERKETHMKSPASEYVTLVEVLELTRPFDEFAAAVQAAAQRLEVEGLKALVTFQFYANPGSSEAGALITFADRSQFLQHANMITGWDEFQQFLSTVKPLEVRVYGKLSAEAEAWVQQFIVVSKRFEQHVAGFVR